jgi:hypothetical protein
MERKRKAPGLETKKNIFYEKIENRNKTPTEIAKDFIIPKKRTRVLMSKREINDYFFLIKCSSKWRTMVNNQFVICKFFGY